MISVPVSCITAYIMIQISEPISVPCTTCTNVGKSARVKEIIVRRAALRQDKDHLTILHGRETGCNYARFAGCDEL